MADKLIEALRSGKIEAVRAVLQADPAAAKSARATMEAGRLAFRKAFELLLKNGADLNGMFRGYRALHSLLQEDAHAASTPPSAERLACLDWLLKHGADPELPGAWPPSRTIIIAAFVGQLEYVRRLRDAGAKVDGFAGAALGDVKLVEKSLRNNAKFARERDVGGLTALQCAAGSRMPKVKALEVARMLLDAGADTKAQTKSWSHSVDATYLAASAKNAGIFSLLLERGADATEALTPALWNRDMKLADIALSHGADPNRATADGQPLLNNLIRWGQMPGTEWLLAHGGSPNIPDERGWTAVHQAASRGNVRMLQACLDAGGDVKRRDKEGETAVDVARRMGKDKVVEMMRESG